MVPRQAQSAQAFRLGPSQPSLSESRAGPSQPSLSPLQRTDGEFSNIPLLPFGPIAHWPRIHPQRRRLSSGQIDISAACNTHEAPLQRENRSIGMDNPCADPSDRGNRAQQRRRIAAGAARCRQHRPDTERRLHLQCQRRGRQPHLNRRQARHLPIEHGQRLRL